MINDNIQDYLKNSENLDDFIKQADQEIADMIAKNTGRNPYNILHEEVVDMATEIWNEFVNEDLPF